MIDCRIASEAFAAYGDKIWISDMRRNALLVYDKNQDECSYLLKFPKEPADKWRMHCAVSVVEKTLYFLPWRSRYLHKFHVDTCEMETVDINMSQDDYVKNGLYYEGKILLLQYRPYNAIIIYDEQNKKKKTIHISEIEENGQLCRDYVLLNKDIYIACRRSSCIYKVNIESETVSSYDLGRKVGGIGTICYDGELFYISTKNAIVSWNETSGEILFNYEFPDGFGSIYMDIVDDELHRQDLSINIEDKQPFSCSAFIKGNVVLFSNYANMCVALPKGNDKITEVKFLDEKESLETIRRTGRITTTHYLGQWVDGQYMLLSTMTNRIYCLTESIFQRCRYIEFFDCLNDRMFERGSVCMEGQECGLQDFLLYIQRMQ